MVGCDSKENVKVRLRALKLRQRNFEAVAGLKSQAEIEGRIDRYECAFEHRLRVDRTRQRDRDPQALHDASTTRSSLARSAPPSLLQLVDNPTGQAEFACHEPRRKSK